MSSVSAQVNATVSEDERQERLLNHIHAKLFLGVYNGDPKMIRPQGGKALEAYNQLALFIQGFKDKDLGKNLLEELHNADVMPAPTFQATPTPLTLLLQGGSAPTPRRLPQTNDVKKFLKGQLGNASPATIDRVIYEINQRYNEIQMPPPPPAGTNP